MRRDCGRVWCEQICQVAESWCNKGGRNAGVLCGITGRTEFCSDRVVRCDKSMDVAENAFGSMSERSRDGENGNFRLRSELASGLHNRT
jgi:hypothetical protein